MNNMCLKPFFAQERLHARHVPHIRALRILDTERDSALEAKSGRFRCNMNQANRRLNGGRVGSGHVGQT